MSTSLQQSLTFAEGLVLYRLVYCPAHQLAPLTRRAYEQDLRAFGRWLDAAGPHSPARLADVSRSHLIEHQATLARQGLAVASRRRKVAALRSYFAFLADEGYLPSSPAAELTPPARERTTPRILSREECARLLAATPPHARDYAIIQLMLESGASLLEVTQLRLRDVRLPKVPDASGTGRAPCNLPGLATVSGRRGQQRFLVLNQTVCQALAAYLRHRHPGPDDHLFLSKFARGMGPRAIERAVEKHLRTAGIRSASPESLRQTATARVAAGS